MFSTQKYMVKNVPVRILNVTSAWRANKLWKNTSGGINFKYLRQRYGQYVAPVVDGDVVDYGSESRCTMKLEEYIALMESNKLGKRYLKDWHFNQLQTENEEPLYETPIYFKDDWLNWWWDQKKDAKDDYRFVYFGPTGSWTPLHHDVFRSYSWSVNICGRKEWIFFSPDQEDKLKDRFKRYVIPDITIKDIDQERFPLVHEANGIRVIQETGEAIFVPSGWYHQVKNLQNTLSINHNWFNGFNIMEIWHFFQKELESVEKELIHLKEIGLIDKEFREQCQIVMLANTGMNYIEFEKLLRAKACDLNTEELTPTVQIHLNRVQQILHELQIYWLQ